MKYPAALQVVVLFGFIVGRLSYRLYGGRVRIEIRFPVFFTLVVGIDTDDGNFALHNLAVNQGLGGHIGAPVGFRMILDLNSTER